MSLTYEPAAARDTSGPTLGALSPRGGPIQDPVLTTSPLPRQSVGGGKSIQNRNGLRFPLLKTTASEGKLTFGDPFLDSGVVRAQTCLWIWGAATGACASARWRNTTVRRWASISTSTLSEKRFPAEPHALHALQGRVDGVGGWVREREREARERGESAREIRGSTRPFPFTPPPHTLGYVVERHQVSFHVCFRAVEEYNCSALGVDLDVDALREAVSL